MKRLRLILSLLLLFLALQLVAAERPKIALAADGQMAANLVDLAIADLGERFDFVERTALDKILAEQKMMIGNPADWLIKVMPILNADFFGVVSSNPQSANSYFSLFYGQNGIRADFIILPAEPEKAVPLLAQSLQKASTRIHDGAIPAQLLSIVSFRAFAIDKANLLEARNLEARLASALQNIDGAAVLEREHLEYLFKEKQIVNQSSEFYRSARLIQLECVPDGDKGFATILHMTDSQGNSVLRREFSGNLRSDVDAMAAALAEALQRDKQIQVLSPEAEAQIFFREFRYAHEHGLYALARKKIYAAIALNPQSIAYRAWAMETITYNDVTPDREKLRDALAEIDLLQGAFDSSYLLAKANGCKESLKEKMGEKQATSPLPPQLKPLPQAPPPPPLPVEEIWRYPKSKELLYVFEYQGSIHFLFNSSQQEIQLYRLDDNSQSKRIWQRPLGDWHFSPNSSIFQQSGDILLLGEENRMMALDLKTLTEGKLIENLPYPRLMAFTQMNGRIYAFCGNGYRESALLSCDLNGENRKLIINNHRLETQNFFDRRPNAMFVAGVAAMEPDSLFFVAHTHSNGGGGYSGLWEYRLDSGRERLIVPLNEPPQGRSMLNANRNDNFFRHDQGTLLFSGAGSISSSTGGFQPNTVFIAYQIADGKKQIISLYPGHQLPPAGAEMLKGPFLLRENKLVISSPDGIFFDGQTRYTLPGAVGLFPAADGSLRIALKDKLVRFSP